MRTFEHSSVVITGGATGIGFALAKAFGKEGARVMITEPRQHRLEEAVAFWKRELKQCGEPVMCSGEEIKLRRKRLVWSVCGCIDQ